MEFTVLLSVGVVIGAVGAVIGSGGGFLLVPLLLLLTELSPQVIAGTSLAVVLLTSFSSTVAYHRHRWIDYGLAKILAAAMIPGALLGVQLNQRVGVESFSILLGAVLMTGSVFLLKGHHLTIPQLFPHPMRVTHRIIDTDGETFEYTVNINKAAMLSLLVGVVAKTVGLGGGVLLAPLMILALRMPARITVATSLAVTFTSNVAAVLLFARYGQIDYALAVPLGIGVLIGAQLGASFAEHSSGKIVRKIMAAALLFVGAWMLATNII